MLTDADRRALAVLDRVLGPNRERGQIVGQVELAIAIRDEIQAALDAHNQDG